MPALFQKDSKACISYQYKKKFNMWMKKIVQKGKGRTMTLRARLERFM